MRHDQPTAAGGKGDVGAEDPEGLALKRALAARIQVGDIIVSSNDAGTYCSMLPYRAYLDATGINLDSAWTASCWAPNRSRPWSTPRSSGRASGRAGS